jgi:zinc and cadmium transporter
MYLKLPEPLINIIIATITVSFFSLTGMISLSLKEETLHKVLFFLVAFSAGSILGAAFFDLLPESLELVSGSIVFVYISLGFTLFFILERFIHWYHGHGHESDLSVTTKDKKSVKDFAYLNVIGDAIHNFIDGMIIAASFIAGFSIGIATTIAVIFHELPQEMGDYGILVYAGLKQKKALLINSISALTVVFGGVFTIIFIRVVETLSGFLIAFSAGSFIYLAASELIPELHEEESFKKSAIQLLIFILGMTLIWILGVVFEE